MRQWLGILLLAWLAGPVLGSELRLAARETVALHYPGAMAVFAVDTSTVETSLVNGEVLLYGRRGGQTLVTVVMPASVTTINVRVDPPASLALAFEAAAHRETGFWEGRYDTGTRRFTTALATTMVQGGTTVRLRLQGVHERAQLGGRDITALPLASIEIESPGRSLVLLDKLVERSPLTLDGVVLRGAHLKEGAVEVHAGIASSTLFDDFLIPSSGDRALEVSTRIDRGAIRFVPSVLLLPDSGTDVPGVVSVGVEYGKAGDALQVKGEIGWSDRLAASIDLDYHDTRRQIWLKGAYRPAGFAALRMTRPAGSYLDGAWSERLGESTTAGLSVSFNRLDLPRSQPEAASARLDLRNQLTDRWSLNGSIGGGSYQGAESQALRRGTVSAGTAYDAPDFGISALYRYQQTSAASQGGHGGRLAIRGNTGGWRGNVFVDAQQQAPTIGLVLQDRSDIARALAELGIAASNPEDVIRQLRDNAALFASRGVTVGTLRLDPLRLQTGMDLSWRGSGARAPEFGMRLVADDAQGVASGRRAFVGTLYANWHFSGNTDLSLSYSRWSVRHEGWDNDDRGSFQLSVRTSFSTLGMPGESSRPITGQVVRDDLANEQAAAARAPLPGVEVVLDRSRRTRTDGDGRFVFDRPGAGAHRVEALLPPKPGAYFTTPSVQTLHPGGDGHFGITFSSARLLGRVQSDGGLPLAGVTLRVEGAMQATAVTDSSGVYRLAGPAGEVRVALAADSLPPGYDLGEIEAQARQLAIGRPATANFTVRAQRGLQGVVAGGKGQAATVLAQEAGRTANADETGGFILRGLPAGPQTLVVKTAKGEMRQVVEVPAEPGMMKGISLNAP